MPGLRRTGAMSRIAVVAVACSSMALQWALDAVPASASTACSINPTTGVVTASSNDTSAHRIHVVGSTVVLDELDCGEVTEVSEFDLDLESTANAHLDFDLSGGPFAPGKGDEGNGSSEIEFFVSNMGTGTTVVVAGSNDPDSLSAGDRLTKPPNSQPVTGIDMNGLADGGTPDEDVVLFGDAGLIELAGAGGDDVLSGAGTGFGGSHPTATSMFLADGFGADALSGGSGDDQVAAHGGPDPGGDTFSGGAGYDRFQYAADDDSVGVSLDGVANDGALCPGAQCENDNVADDFEEIRGTDFADVLIGGPGDQLISGGAGNDTLGGGPGNDTLIGSAGSDSFSGGAGVDTVSYADAATGVIVKLDGLSNDGAPGEHDNVEPNMERVIGGNGDDHLTGSDLANTLVGAAGVDVLSGLGGNDVLEPGTGDDTSNGGPGSDTVSFADSAHPVSAGIGNGAASGDGADALAGVERLRGSVFDDHLTGSDGPNRLTGGGGDDHLRGLAGHDVLTGGPGDDTLDGGADSDTCTQGPGSGPVTHCEH
jgi:Ca2+-binding RTX toxin-like protein